MENIEKVEKFGQIDVIQDKKSEGSIESNDSRFIDNDIMSDLRKMD